MVKYTKQFVGKLPKNCLSMFDHFVELALKRVKMEQFAKNINGFSHYLFLQKPSFHVWLGSEFASNACISDISQ